MNEKNPPLRDGDSAEVYRSTLARASDAMNDVIKTVGWSDPDFGTYSLYDENL